MKPRFAIILITLLLPFIVRANQDCIWTSSEAGITINYIAPCNFKNQNLLDSVLHRAVTSLNRGDTTLKILVLLNFNKLSFPGDNITNFYSIGYDTLRPINDDYIFKYYWNQESISTGENNGLNKFKSKSVPLDINYTDVSAKDLLGIKIIYDNYIDQDPHWSGIISEIIYGAQNAESIKLTQKRDTVRYNSNGWYVSLVSIDTLTIKSILGIKSESKPIKANKVEDKHKTESNLKYYLLSSVLLVLAIFIIKRKKITQKN